MVPPAWVMTKSFQLKFGSISQDYKINPYLKNIPRKGVLENVGVVVEFPGSTLICIKPLQCFYKQGFGILFRFTLLLLNVEERLSLR